MNPSSISTETRGSSAGTLLVIIAGGLFCMSGVAALVYQVTWQRILALHSGMGIYSVAMIVASFIAGLEPPRVFRRLF